jgi:hypothetical protein
MHGYRSILAHMLPGEISDDRVWTDTVEATPRLLQDLRGRR